MEVWCNWEEGGEGESSSCLIWTCTSFTHAIYFKSELCATACVRTYGDKSRRRVSLYVRLREDQKGWSPHVPAPLCPPSPPPP